jgi:hypothetical protein
MGQGEEIAWVDGMRKTAIDLERDSGRAVHGLCESIHRV